LRKDDSGVQAFIRGFLAPAAADGALTMAEELPLFAAYEAFDIESWLASDPSTALHALRETVRSPSAVAPMAPLAAWELLLENAHRLTESQLILAAEWFHQHGVTVQLAGRAGGGVSSPALHTERYRRFTALLDRVAPETLTRDSARGTASQSGLVIRTFDAEALAYERAADGLSSARLLADAGRLVEATRDVLAGHWNALLAFDEYRRGPSDFVIRAPVDPDQDLWFIGDVHGSLLALECVLAHIRRQAGRRPPVIVWMGDLVDRGQQSLEVVLRLFQQIADRPGSVCFLAGNHDESLQWRDERQAFGSSVLPSEFAEYLNSEQDPTVHDVARAFVEFVARSPRALFLTDGLFAAHGGIPQRDMWPTLTSQSALNQPLCLQDFVWTRAHPRAKRRNPGRSTRGADFGRDDFREFCDLASEVLGLAVMRMVRGHDHVDGQHCLYDEYRERQLLTITTMGAEGGAPSVGARVYTPCAARWVHGSLPEVHRVVVPEPGRQEAWA